MKQLFFTFILFVCPLFLWAQNSSGIDRRVVYLWDVTYSMHGGYYDAKGGNGKVTIAGQEYSIKKYSKKHDIYNDILEKLIDAIKKEENPKTEIVVVPFGAEVLGGWTYRATDSGKAALEKHIRSFCELREDKVQKTNIGEALQYTKNCIFEASVPNTLKILTDGIENVNKERFYHILDTWCDFSTEKNVQGYYFILATDAINPDLKTRLEQCCFTVIDDLGNGNNFSLPISEFEIKGPSSVSLKDNYENKKIELGVSTFDNASIQGSVNIKVTSVPNSYVSVDSEISIDSQTRTVSLPIKYKQQLSNLLQTMTTDEKGTPIILKLQQVSGSDKNSLRTQELTFNIINKELKTLQIEIVK